MYCKDTSIEPQHRCDRIRDDKLGLFETRHRYIRPGLGNLVDIQDPRLGRHTFLNPALVIQEQLTELL